MKRIASLVLILLPFVFTLSCKEKEDPQEVKPASLTVVVTGADGVVTVPMYQIKEFDVKVTAEPGPEASLSVTLGGDATQVAAYNSAHGTSYTMLPSDAFELPATPFVLPRYNKTSPVATLRLKGTGCEIDKEYLLPIVVDKAEGADWEFVGDNAAYIVFKMTPAEQQGSGTAADPYLINDVNEFLKVGNLLKDNDAVYFKMAGDVDFSGIEYTEENPWKPINYAAPDDEEAKPAARARVIHFDGNGHKISNFKAGGPLFGTFCGSIQNLTVEGAAVDSDTDDGAIIVGVAGASDKEDGFVMKNVKVVSSSLINDHKRSGALVAHMRNGIVENCTADCTMDCQQQVGGFIGRVDNGTITNCSSSGKVTSSLYYVGGFIGWAGAVTIKNSSCTGEVVTTNAQNGYSRIGGFIGQMEGSSTIEKCYATGNVTGTGHFGGGLIGIINGDNLTVTVSRCYATGNIDLPHGDKGNQSHAGALIGSIAGSGTGQPTVLNVNDCYATGSVAIRRYSSGFVGSIYGNPGILNIKNGFTTSDITGIVLADRCGLVLGLMDAADKGSSATCTGFVAWNTSDRAFSYNDCVPVAGNYYGTEGTVSQQAKALGWDESIWDLSKDIPSLK